MSNSILLDPWLHVKSRPSMRRSRISRITRPSTCSATGRYTSSFCPIGSGTGQSMMRAGRVTSFAAHVHHQVERLARDDLQSLGKLAVDAEIPFSPAPAWSAADDRRRRQARALRLHHVRAVGARERLRHLAAAGISDAHEQHPLLRRRRRRLRARRRRSRLEPASAAASDVRLLCRRRLRLAVPFERSLQSFFDGESRRVPQFRARPPPCPPSSPARRPRAAGRISAAHLHAFHFLQQIPR